MKPHTNYLLLAIVAAFVPATAPGQVALLVESTRAAPKVEREKNRPVGEEARRSLVLVVDESEELKPSVLASAAYKQEADLLQEPPANADEMILLPEFVVRGDLPDAQREAMMKRLSADIHRLESAGFDLTRGGRQVARHFGNARLTVGNDDERPGFSFLTLEW